MATRKSTRKSPRKPGTNPGGVSDALVPQQHGGRIYQGPAKNPVAGPGRPPNQLREAMRGDLDKLLPDLWKKYKASEIDALDFANFLAKFGLGTKDEIDIMHPMFQAEAQRYHAIMEQAIRANVSAQVADRIMEQARDAITQRAG